MNNNNRKLADYLLKWENIKANINFDIQNGI